MSVAVIAAFAVVWGDVYLAVGGAVIWAGVFLALQFAARHVQRQITDETGLSRRQIPVIARRMRKERLPVDPKARLAMTILTQRQLKWIRQGRWSPPVLVCLYVLLGSTSVATGDEPAGTIWLALAVLAVLLVLSQRRAVHRLERIRAHLSPTPDQ
ncbi:hypothetical protein [Streptomyces sp. CA-111067]|uniref:hypothetical protein n=1 Tax=Streptomyces sp. CA-111067 TaxID=3240046 RepID=UPI003D98AFA0